MTMRNGCCDLFLQTHLDGVINLPFATFLLRTDSYQHYLTYNYYSL